MAEPRNHADAGIRTRITTATGSDARRITPRRHACGDRPGRNRTGDLRIQSPASLASGDSGATHNRRCGSTVRASGTRWTRPPARPVTPLSSMTEIQSAADTTRLSPHRARNCRWVGVGGRPVFPRPGRVLRVRGRVMRVDMSGHRRSESRFRIRRDRTSSGWARISPDTGREGIGRPRDPRLNANEQAAEQCESASSCELTSVTGSSKTLLRCQCGDCIKPASCVGHNDIPPA